MQKYRFLPFAAKVLRILGWIVLVVGVIGSIILGIGIPSIYEGINGATGILIAVGGIICSFLGWVFLLTTRELLYLLVDVEENTRNTAERITITKKSS